MNFVYMDCGVWTVVYMDCDVWTARCMNVVVSGLVVYVLVYRLLYIWTVLYGMCSVSMVVLRTLLTNLTPLCHIC